MINKFVLAWLIVFSSSLTSFASPVIGISQMQWTKVIDKVENVMKPYWVNAGFDIRIKRDWEASDVNAYSMPDVDDKNIRYIRVMGGLARNQGATEDALATIVCHEIGHSMGGYSPNDHKPLWVELDQWASSEGAADYFASSKCLRAYFKDQDNKKYLESIEVPEYLAKQCQTSWINKENADVCIRTALAGRQFFKFVAGMDYAFDTPDTSIIKKPLQSYPSDQCRLDTYFQGALCTVDETIMPSHSDHLLGVCNDTIGARPLCWYLKI